MTLTEVVMRCDQISKKIDGQQDLIGDLARGVEKSENTINVLLDKICKLESTIEIQKCFINISQRVSEELKLQFDDLAQKREERLVVTGEKISLNETPMSLKEDVCEKISVVVNKDNLKMVHRIGRKHGNTQDVLLVFNTKSTKKDVFYNRKKINNLYLRPYITRHR